MHLVLSDPLSNVENPNSNPSDKSEAIINMLLTNVLVMFSENAR
jgi:hypothetical protein